MTDKDDSAKYAGMQWRKTPDEDGRFIWETKAYGVIVRSTEKLDETEASAYVVRAIGLFKHVYRVNVEVDGDYATVSYDLKHGNFERIRRITGYLVGTLDRFNDAKRAEESERVKHGVSL